VFFTYNYFDHVVGPLNTGAVGRVDVQTAIVDGNPTIITTPIPGVAPAQLNLHRQGAGFGETFLDGEPSIGRRAPMVEQQGDITFGNQLFGDLSVILKYAFLNDRTTGDVLSGGLVVTAPTGASVLTVAGDIHDTLLQPWLGGIWNLGDVFVHGFTSVVV